MPAVPPSPRVKLRTATRRVPRTRNAESEGSAVPDSEPNMRLSRAIMVMLLLHVVAVGGILAFSLIKERGHRHAAPGSPGAAVEAEDSDLPATKVEGTGSDHGAQDQGGSRTNVHVVRPGETLTRIANDNGVSVDALRAANDGEALTTGLRPGLQLKLPDKGATNSVAPSTAASDAVERIESGRTNMASTPGPSSSTSGDKNNRLPADSGKTYTVGKGESAYTIAQKLKVEPASLLKLNQIDDPKKLKPGQKLRVPAASHGKAK